MSSTTRSMRLNRFGNSSELKNNSSTAFEGYSTESFKLPTLRAINKSVKYNDLSFATTRDLNKLRKEPEEIQNIQQVSAHHSLMIMRKKYDNMNKQREQRQKSIDQMEKKKEKYQTQKKRFEDQKTQGLKKVVSLESDLSTIKLGLEESQMQKKVLLGMIERLKSDKIVYDLRKYNGEKQLVYIQKQNHIILQQNASKMQESDRTKKIYQKLLDHLEAEQREREHHLGNMHAMISEKVSLQENTSLRQSEMNEIAENTLQDKDIKEKNWYKVHLCHKFVSKLLRDKMSREMVKFNIVQVAFKNIKTSTGVNTAQSLVKKFLNKENAYGQLLGKIAQNQRYISSLKLQNEDLMKQRRNLKTERDNINSNKVIQKDLTKQEKEFHQVSQKSLKCQMYIEKVKSWVGKNQKKFNSIEDNHKQVKDIEKTEEIVNHFNEYLNRITKILQQNVTFEDKKNDLNVSIGSNNLRIRFQEAKQSTKDIKIMDKKYNDEQDFVDNQRSEMIRNNEKYMKEIKRKYQEERKAKIEAEPKKKEVVAQKPKPVQL